MLVNIFKGAALEKGVSRARTEKAQEATAHGTAQGTWLREAEKWRQPDMG